MKEGGARSHDPGALVVGPAGPYQSWSERGGSAFLRNPGILLQRLWKGRKCFVRVGGVTNIYYCTTSTTVLLYYCTTSTTVLLYYIYYCTTVLLYKKEEVSSRGGLCTSILADSSSQWSDATKDARGAPSTASKSSRVILSDLMRVWRGGGDTGGEGGRVR